MAVDISQGGLQWKAGIDLNQFKLDIQSIKTDLQSLSQQQLNANGIVGGMQQIKAEAEATNNVFKGMLKGAAAVFSIHEAKNFISEMIDVRGEFQQIENAIETITGSQEKMNSLMTEWKSLTLRSPFRLSEIAQSGKQLLAMGIATQDVTHDIEMLANIASGVSAPVQDIAEVFGQVKTQGKAMSEDLNQFAGRGIPIISSLAKVLNTTEDNVKNLASQSKISFSEINAAFELMTSQGGQFYNLIGKQADTLPGQINRLKHEIELMFNEMGEKSEGFLGGAISGVSFLVEHYQNIAKILSILIATYGTYRAAIIVTTAANNAASVSYLNLANATTAESGAMAKEITTKVINATQTASLTASILELTNAKLSSALATENEIRKSFQSAATKESEAIATANLATQNRVAAELEVANAEQQVASLTAYTGAKARANAEKSLTIAQNNLLVASEEEVTAAQIAQTATANANIQQAFLNKAAKESEVLASKAKTASIEAETAATNLQTVAQEKLTFTQSIGVSITNKLAKAQAILKDVFVTNPIYAVVAGLTALIGVWAAYADGVSNARSSQELLSESMKENTDNTSKEEAQVRALILTLQNHNINQQKRKQTYDEINAINPSILKGLTLEQAETANLTSRVNEYIISLKEAIRTKRMQSAYEKAINQRDDISEQYEAYNSGQKKYSAFDRFNEGGILSLFVGSENATKQHLSTLKWQLGEADKVVSDIEAKMGKSIEQNNKVQDEGTKQQTVKNKAYWEAQKKTAQDGLDGLADTTSKEAQKYKAQINEANAKLKYYDVAGIEKQGQAANIALEKSNERLRVSQEKIKSIMDEINGVNDTYSVKFSDDQYATQAKQVTDAIGKIKDEIVKFNADPKNKIKISESVNTRLDNMQSSLLSDLRYSFQTDQIKQQLDEQKTEWENYEKARIALGQDAALKIYGNDKAQFKSYLDYLQSQQQKEFPSVDNSDDINHLGISVKPDDLKELSAVEQARNKMYAENIKERQNAESQSEKQQADETLRLVQSTAEKVLAIQTKYQKQKEDLQKQGLLTPERSALIDENQKADFDSLNESLKGNQEKIAQQAKNIAASTKDAIGVQITALQKYVDVHTELTEKEKRNIKELIKQLGILQITATNNPNAGKNVWSNLIPQSVTDRQTELNQQTQQVSKLKDEYKDLTTISDTHPIITPQDQINAVAVNVELEKSENILKRMQAIKPFLDIADYADLASSKLSELSSALEGFGGNGSYMADNLSKLASSVSSVAKGTASLIQGDPLGAIDVVKGVTSVFKLGKSIKAMNAAARAEQKKFYDEAIAGELKYQATLRQRAVTLAAQSSRNSYKSTLAQLDELKKQAPAVQKAFDKIFASLQGEQYIEGVGYKHGTLLRKAKTWDIMASLSGSTYDQMEDLYNQGKLKDDAKAYFEQLQSLKEEMDAAGVSATDLQNSLDQMFVGSDLDGFVDQFKDLTQQMLSGTADLGASIEDILKNSILNAFKYKYLSDQLEPLYDSLAKALQDGDGYPTADFLANWKSSVTDVMTNATDQLKYIQDQTGIDLTSTSSTNNLTGSIQRSLTEQTGDELAGLYRNNNDLIRQQTNILRQQMSIATQNLQSVQQIQINTAETVNQLKAYLPTIADNTQGSYRTSRDIFNKL